MSLNDWEIKHLNFIIIMLKNILDLEGVTVLSKEQQKNINGAGPGDDPLIPIERCGYIIDGNTTCKIPPNDGSWVQPTCYYVCVNGRWVRQ